MFSAATWGTVSDVCVAIGTIAAVAAAAAYYIYDSMRDTRSQARQIRASLVAVEDAALSIEVRNDSQQQITGVYLRFAEDRLSSSLLRRDDFLLRSDVESDPEAVPTWHDGGRTDALQRRKRDVYGFDDRSGVIDASDSLIGGGGGYNFADDLVDHEYRLSTSYWVGFQDAKGNLWELAANRVQWDGRPRLRGVRSSASARGARDESGDPLIWLFVKRPARTARVAVWLINNRHDKTTTVIPTNTLRS